MDAAYKVFGVTVVLRALGQFELAIEKNAGTFAAWMANKPLFRTHPMGGFHAGRLVGVFECGVARTSGRKGKKGSR